MLESQSVGELKCQSVCSQRVGESESWRAEESEDTLIYWFDTLQSLL